MTCKAFHCGQFSTKAQVQCRTAYKPPYTNSFPTHSSHLDQFFSHVIGYSHLELPPAVNDQPRNIDWQKYNWWVELKVLVRFWFCSVCPWSKQKTLFGTNNSQTIDKPLYPSVLPVHPMRVFKA